MRNALALALTAGGLFISASTASAQSLPNSCLHNCPPCSRAATLIDCPRYSGHCFYPCQQRPIPPDPYCRQQAQGPVYNPYIRSPRDFWMWQGCCNGK